jgi:hypothetical protein
MKPSQMISARGDTAFVLSLMIVTLTAAIFCILTLSPGLAGVF